MDIIQSLTIPFLYAFTFMFGVTLIILGLVVRTIRKRMKMMQGGMMGMPEMKKSDSDVPEDKRLKFR